MTADNGNKRKARATAGKTIVRLSLAVAMLMPLAEAANAQIALNCTRALTYDTFADCGGGGGSITVTPNTGKVSTGGCIVTIGGPLAARCTVKSFPTTKSVKVQLSMKTASIKGVGTMTVNKFNVATSGGGATKTFPATAITSTPLSFDVGGRLNVNAGQTIGAYSGKVVITVTQLP